MPPPLRDNFVRPRRRKLGEYIKQGNTRIYVVCGAVAIMIALAGIASSARLFLAEFFS